MTNDDAVRRLHHDLRGLLSAVQLDLETLHALESADQDLSAEKRLKIVARAKQALGEAVEVAERIRTASAP